MVGKEGVVLEVLVFGFLLQTLGRIFVETCMEKVKNI